MSHPLICHPQNTSLADTDITCDVVISREGILTLQCHMTATMAGVRLPTQSATIRADSLWKHTCFEAFIQPRTRERYVELNVSPSHAWAAYQFSAYRAGMQNLDIPTPEIITKCMEQEYRLEATVNLSNVPLFSESRSWKIGLAAVIETNDGNLSYWALDHPFEKPDFHHPHGFVYEVDVAP